MKFEYLSDKVIQFRHDLHQIPEIGFLVYKTSSYVKKVLEPLDCIVSTIVTTGVLAYFDFGCEETIVFRADMDGLPIEEETGLDFSSINKGCMHACGHDGHMANMLGFAHILDSYKKENKKVNYNALLLFQPAEETIDGAIRICGTHIFDKYKVKAIFGLHLWPMLSKGEISTIPGPMMARSTEVNVDFEGLSAHCGEPDKGHDALEAACLFLTHMYRYKEAYIKDRSILKFGFMNSGNVRNAISDSTILQGTMRTFKEDTWNELVDAMHKLSGEIEELMHVSVKVDVSKSHPAVVNDPGLYKEIKPFLQKLNFVEMRRPVTIAEDFAFFEKELPGVFFFLGTGSYIPLHSSNYTFDDDVLMDGMKLFDTLFLSMP